MLAGTAPSVRSPSSFLLFPSTETDFPARYLFYTTNSTLGPSLGAYFASRPLPISTPSRLPLPFPILGVNSIKLNSYAFPALITLVLLTVETAFLWWKLPETKGWLKEEEQEETGESKEGEKKVIRSQEEREKRLNELQLVHFGFLFFFSGEFGSGAEGGGAEIGKRRG